MRIPTVIKISSVCSTFSRKEAVFFMRTSSSRCLKDQFQAISSYLGVKVNKKLLG